MEEVLGESQWKVSYMPNTFTSRSHNFSLSGDVTLSAEDRPHTFSSRKQPANGVTQIPVDHSAADDLEHEDDGYYDDHDHESEHHSILDGHPAIKFLLAGGVAGAGECQISASRSLLTICLVSRTFTAPFDRLKIFLMTRPPDLGGTPLAPRPGLQGAKAIANAVSRIYMEGGVLAFWTGNGLSVAKIFPESAIKFMTYESTVSRHYTIIHEAALTHLYRNEPLLSM